MTLSPAVAPAGTSAPLVPPPRPRAPLLGRERELARAEDRLRRADVGLLTLTGAGGSGKTRLALALAARQQGYFPDGVAWVPLAPLATPDQVMPAIGRALGVRDVPGEPLDETLARVLRDRVLLLVLDNFEHVLAAAPGVAELLLRCAGLKALVTSRAPLRVSGEQELPVLPLGLPPVGTGPTDVAEIAQAPSVALWCQRVTAVDPSFELTADNAPLVAEICRRLDGLPLAIELAAARARVFPPRALLERLSHRLAVLTGGPRDLPERQQTLRGAIGWSYDLLRPAEQALFRRLAVFQGGCTLEAATAVAAATSDLGTDVDDGISTLVDYHLLVRREPIEGQPRLGMLETIREFGLEQLKASGEAELARRAHAEYFAHLAERAEPILHGPARGPWLRRLDADQANIRAALEWAVGHDAADVGFRLIGAVWLWCWLSFHESRQWVTALRSVPSASAASLPRAKALNAVAIVAWGDGDTAAAHTLADEAVALCRELDDRPTLAHALMTLGASTGKDRPTMEALYAEAISLVDQAGDPWWVAFGRLCHAIAAAQLGETLTARAEAAEAAARFERLEEPFFLGLAQLQVGFAELLLGHPAEARAQLEACLPVLRGIHDWKYTGVALIGLGTAARAIGDARGAASAYVEALALCRDAGAAGDLPLCLEGLAAAALGLGQADRAVRLLGAADTAHAAGFTPTIPGFEQAYQATARAVAAALGEATFAADSVAGRALPLAGALAEAHNLLAAASSAETRRPATGATSAGLSDREVEVLRLLASGRSNAEIATELVLSVRTVEKHVANIYAKIGARGRAEAATYALREGLLPTTPEATRSGPSAT